MVTLVAVLFLFAADQQRAVERGRQVETGSLQVEVCFHVVYV